MKTNALILIALSAICGSANAETIHLYTEKSKAGESMDAFVKRVAPAALDRTFKADAAVCGLIGSRPDGTFAIAFHTNGDPWRCTLSMDLLPAGYGWTGLVFRTHTRRGADDWTESDMRIPGYLATDQKLTCRKDNIWRKLADF